MVTFCHINEGSSASLETVFGLGCPGFTRSWVKGRPFPELFGTYVSGRFVQTRVSQGISSKHSNPFGSRLRNSGTIPYASSPVTHRPRNKPEATAFSSISSANSHFILNVVPSGIRHFCQRSFCSLENQSSGKNNRRSKSAYPFRLA